MKTSAFQRGEVNPPRRKQIKVSAESRLHPCSAQGRRGLQHGRVRGSAHGSPQDWGPTEARRTGDPRKPAGLGTHGSPQDTGSASHLESSSVKPTRSCFRVNPAPHGPFLMFCLSPGPGSWAQPAESTPQ
ncbi:uncharacterized protein LOC107401520 isoform X2 [Peromyscus maniculatus bairdii]|uniref:uncharacterized protein LOC107401520 isoform X2 n=1 Tax=Peromyscus maniculatus bairdii TaxID=230844 RepID=UPI003FD698C1